MQKKYGMQGHILLENRCYSLLRIEASKGENDQIWVMMEQISSMQAISTKTKTMYRQCSYYLICYERLDQASYQHRTRALQFNW